MSQQPQTTKPENVENDDFSKGSGFPYFLLIFIASPLSVLAAFGTYLLFSLGKIRLSVIALFVLAPSLVVLLLSFSVAIPSFISSWTTIIPSIISGSYVGSVVGGIFTALAMQALVAIPIGITAGLGYSMFRWYTRPAWIETKFRLTPWEILNKKRVIKEISEDLNTPQDGMTLGITENGERIIQTYDESVAHTLLFGASGAGKTRTLMSRLRDSIKAGQGAVIVDLKGDPYLTDEIAGLAKRYDRRFQHWTFSDPDKKYEGPAPDGAAFYDPVCRGDAIRRRDLLIDCRTNWEEYYKGEASFYLELVMSIIVANPSKVKATIPDAIDLLNPLELQKRAIPLGSDPRYADLVLRIDEIAESKMEPGRKNAIGSLQTILQSLGSGVTGPQMRKDPSGINDIDLFRTAHEGEIVVFTLDTGNYPLQSALVANLIIQDLKTVSSELRLNKPEKPFQVIIDEFSAVGSDNIVGLVNKCRDARMPVTLTTQALADLDQQSSTLRERLLAIVNSYIIHRTNVFKDAEELAELSGTVKKYRFNEQVVYRTGILSSLIGRGSGAGKGSIQEEIVTAIDPDAIQKLDAGQFFYINKTPQRFVYGQGILENTPVIASEPPLLTNFVKREAPENVNENVAVVGGTETPFLVSPPTEASYVEDYSYSVPHVSSPVSEKPSLGSQERLRGILGKDPSSALSRNESIVDNVVEKLEQIVEEPVAILPSLPVLPESPKVAPVLPSPNTPVGLPSIPSLPTLPALPFPKNETLPVENKTIGLPPLATPPVLPKPPVAIKTTGTDSNKDEVKDKYEF